MTLFINGIIVACVLLNLNVIVIETKVCPSSYTLHRVSNVCYSISSSKQNWDVARTQCRHSHGDLISIHNQFLYNHLKGHVPQGHENGVWVGARDRAHEGHFKWVDGRPLTERWWAPSQPNDWGGSEDCVHIFNYGSSNDLNDYGCQFPLKFICEVEGCTDIQYCKRNQQICTHKSNTCKECDDNKVFYKPIQADTVCGQMCSWNGFYCWPGNCTDELAVGCSCSTGFYKNTTSKQVTCQCKLYTCLLLHILKYRYI